MYTYDWDIDSIQAVLEGASSGVSLEVSDGIKQAETDQYILEIGNHNGHQFPIQYWEPVPNTGAYTVPSYQNGCTYNESPMQHNGGAMGDFINIPVGQSDNVMTLPSHETVQCHSTNDNIKRRKRRRTTFTISQRIALENEYNKHSYIDRNRRLQLANEINLNERIIKIWYQNQRMKHKKELREAMQ